MKIVSLISQEKLSSLGGRCFFHQKHLKSKYKKQPPPLLIILMLIFTNYIDMPKKSKHNIKLKT